MSKLVAVSLLGVVAGAGAPSPAVGPGAHGTTSRRPATPTIAVRVALPATDNLQWMNFWVALGAGYFAEEGVEVELVVGGAPNALVSGAADVAVLPRPAFVNQIGRRQPVVAFANLLANDPISLVVPRRIAQARGISDDLTVADRLRALRGSRVGVAPGPPPRLRYLLESSGLDPRSHLEIVIVEGPEQNQALESGRVDALYAHTPYLERALVDQDAVLVVNQSVGEVDGLSDRQIHMLVTTRAYAEASPDVLVRMARAVHRAQRLIHGDRPATIAALHASGVTLRAPHALEVVVELYEPAVPRSPEVSVEGVLRELELFPDRRPLPDLSGIDLSAHVDNRFAQRAIAGGG